MKKQFLFLFYLLAGILTGALIGNLCSGIPTLSWLGYAQSIGFSPNSPAIIDLIIVKLTFGFSMAISVAQVITISFALYLYSKLRIR